MAASMDWSFKSSPSGTRSRAPFRLLRPVVMSAAKDSGEGDGGGGSFLRWLSLIIIGLAVAALASDIPAASWSSEDDLREW